MWEFRTKGLSFETYNGDILMMKEIHTAFANNAAVKPILLKATWNSSFILVRQTNVSSVFNEKFTPSFANLQKNIIVSNQPLTIKKLLLQFLVQCIRY